MIRLLRLLWAGDWHVHIYRILKQSRVESDYGTHTRYYCQCTLCGKIKKFG